MKEILWPITFYFFIGALTGSYLISGIFILCGARGTRRINFQTLLYGFTLGPIMEEIIFRGPVYLLVWLSAPSWACWTIISIWGGILFGLIHLINFTDIRNWIEEPNARKAASDVIVAIFFGIILGWLVVNTQSLLPAIIVHSGMNLIGLIILYVQTERASGKLISLSDYLNRRY